MLRFSMIVVTVITLLDGRREEGILRCKWSQPGEKPCGNASLLQTFLTTHSKNISNVMHGSMPKRMDCNDRVVSFVILFTCRGKFRGDSICMAYFLMSSLNSVLITWSRRSKPYNTSNGFVSNIVSVSILLVEMVQFDMFFWTGLKPPPNIRTYSSSHCVSKLGMTKKFPKWFPLSIGIQWLCCESNFETPSLHHGWGEHLKLSLLNMESSRFWWCPWTHAFWKLAYFRLHSSDMLFAPKYVWCTVSRHECLRESQPMGPYPGATGWYEGVAAAKLYLWKKL